jgi:hypothetical protein
LRVFPEGYGTVIEYPKRVDITAPSNNDVVFVSAENVVGLFVHRVSPC